MDQTIQEVHERAAAIKLVIFDVDGILTDGSLFYSDDGQEFKVFNSRDGHGMKMLLASGIKIAIITARSSPTVSHRMANLGVEDVYQGQQEKLPAFEALLNKYSLEPREAAYVGDDVVDLPIMLRVGLAITAQDSYPLVQKHAHWQTPSSGGRGAARDVCEMIMDAQGSLDEQLQKYLIS